MAFEDLDVSLVVADKNSNEDVGLNTNGNNDKINDYAWKQYRAIDSARTTKAGNSTASCSLQIISECNPTIITTPTNNTSTVTGYIIGARDMRMLSHPALMVHETIANSGTIILEFGSSIIASSLAGTQLTYRRTSTTDNWYLVSSPVADRKLYIDNKYSFVSGTGNKVGLVLDCQSKHQSHCCYFQTQTWSFSTDVADAKMFEKLGASNSISFIVRSANSSKCIYGSMEQMCPKTLAQLKTSQSSSTSQLSAVLKGSRLYLYSISSIGLTTDKKEAKQRIGFARNAKKFGIGVLDNELHFEAVCSILKTYLVIFTRDSIQFNGESIQPKNKYLPSKIDHSTGGGL